MKPEIKEAILKNAINLDTSFTRNFAYLKNDTLNLIPVLSDNGIAIVAIDILEKRENDRYKIQDGNWNIQRDLYPQLKTNPISESILNDIKQSNTLAQNYIENFDYQDDVVFSIISLIPHDEWTAEFGHLFPLSSRN